MLQSWTDHLVVLYLYEDFKFRVRLKESLSSGFVKGCISKTCFLHSTAALINFSVSCHFSGKLY